MTKRYLVTLEDNGSIIAGVYVQAVSKHEAELQVREYLDRCKLVVWPRA